VRDDARFVQKGDTKAYNSIKCLYEIALPLLLGGILTGSAEDGLVQNKHPFLGTLKKGIAELMIHRSTSDDPLLPKQALHTAYSTKTCTEQVHKDEPR